MVDVSMYNLVILKSSCYCLYDQYAPSTIAILVDYPDQSVLLIFGLVTFIFYSRRYMPFTAITTCTFINILYFPTVELIQNTPPTLTLPHPLVSLIK